MPEEEEEKIDKAGELIREARDVFGETRSALDEVESRLARYGLYGVKPVDRESYLRGFRDGWDSGVEASLKLVEMFFEMWYRMQKPAKPATRGRRGEGEKTC